MSERQSSAASETSQTKAGAPTGTQRPGSAQSQRRTPQKLGPRKHSHQNQPSQSSTQTPSAHETERLTPESANSRPVTGAAKWSQPNGTNQQHRQTSQQSEDESRTQSRRRHSRRRGRGRSKTQTSESDTGSVSEVAQGGRRNRNRRKPKSSSQINTQDAQDPSKPGGRPLDTLDEVGENADGVMETAQSTTGGVKKNLQGSVGGWTASKKKGKGKEEEKEEEKESTLRLRIDLDLDVELELKAKIQGAVTLALLD